MKHVPFENKEDMGNFAVRHKLCNINIIMMNNPLFRATCLFLGLAGAYTDGGWAQQTRQPSKALITVNVDQPSHKISPTLFGVFLEDINLSVDGGLYPELVRNRSFEDADSLQYWTFDKLQGKSTATVMKAELNDKEPLPPLNPFNRTFLSIHAQKRFRLNNYGYWGMNIVQGDTYIFKTAIRLPNTQHFEGKIWVRLTGENGNTLAEDTLKGFTNHWQYFTLSLNPTADNDNSHLEIEGEGNGTLFLDMVSLMPEKRWKKSGVRTDLAKALEDLKPKFFRFPGGCWVEGDDLAHRYQWKHTIGDIDQRIPLWNIWEYNATHGLGYHEYLQLAEDLGAEPLFCINAGISHKESVKAEQLGQWIQDALDAIEYANGPTTSVWGSIRARNGHPEPFHLKYIEIGNENFGTDYFRNYELIANAISTKYPEIKLIANDWAGLHPTTPTPDLVDEHYYNHPDWFIINANRYDTYDRKDPKVFVGEYAVTSKTGKGNLRGAIGEAAFMTGLERNSDVVAMAAYAPLFCHVNHKRWPINLINFDHKSWYGLPSYYVQKLFAENQGTVNLPLTVSGSPQIEKPKAYGRIGLGTWKNSAEFKDLKVTAPDGSLLYANDFSAPIDDWTQTGDGDWSVKDGVLRQQSMAPNVTAFVGDSTWTDYTITLKARKIYGENGFQIYFHNHVGSGRIRWDIGGYGNAINEMQAGIVAQSMNYSLNPGQWHAIRLEVSSTGIKGYIDGKLVQEITDNHLNPQKLCASAALDEKSGDLILKVVNTDTKALRTTIHLKAEKKYKGKGSMTVLTSNSPLDENTLENPTLVSPQKKEIKISENKIQYNFPGNSLSIIRIPINKKEQQTL